MLLVTTWACKIWIYHITNWIEKSLFEILWEISSSTCHAFFLNPRQSYSCKEHANSLKQPRQSLNPRSLFLKVQTAKHYCWNLDDLDASLEGEEKGLLQTENWKNSTNFDVQQQCILCFCLEVDLTDTKPEKRCMK